MLRGRWSKGVVLVLLLVGLAAARQGHALVQTNGDPVTASAQDPERDRAVQLARSGEFDEALPILRRLHEAAPADTGLRADLAAALSWAGRDEEAFELGGHLPFDELPPIIAESVARSARNLALPVFAAGLYRSVVERDPSRVESQIGYTLALVEAQDVDRALARADTLMAFHPEVPDAGLAAGHVYAAAERWFDAALTYRSVRSTGEHVLQAARGEARALREAGASLLALELVRTHPDAFPPELRADLVAGGAARWAEWASVIPEQTGPAQRFAPADRAIERIDEAIAELEALDPAAVRIPLERIRADRLVALRERERMDELLADVHALEESGIQLPPFAQRLGGDAALAVGRVDEAIRRYRTALEGWPDHPETTLGLFWALVEARRFDQADALVADFLERQPESFRVEGVGEPVSNVERLPLITARHLGWAFGGRLEDARNALDTLHRRAPMNAGLRQELASVLLWRGWPRRAEELYRRTLTVDPDRTGARVGRVEAALDTDERGRARTIVDTLLRTAPEDEHVVRVARRIEVRGSWEMSSRYESGRSTGGVLGTSDHSLVTRLTSPPIADRTRFFAGSRRSDARFPEGRGVHDRLLAGIDVRSQSLLLEIGAHVAREGERRPGVTGRAELRGDHWSLALSGESRTTDTPLRAARSGIEGWTAGLALRRRAHEAREWGIEAGYLQFEDGNRRPSVHVTLEQQFTRTPAHRFALLVEGWGSTNSREDAPYFNPSRTLSGSGSLLWDWTWFDRRDRSYAQRLSLVGGAVAQEGFGTEPVTSVVLDHRWEMNDRFELNYGVSWGLPVYDGVQERRTAGHLGLVWRIP